MKLAVLLENTAHRADLVTEHGLSLYLETGAHRILFDAGQSDAFARNAAAMGIDLAAVDLAVLSHGHYDHGGGLPYFLQQNNHAPVYLHPRCFGSYYNGKARYIGLDAALKNSPRLRFVEGCFALDEGLTLFDCNSYTPVKNLNPYGLTKLENGQLQPDDFLHEQYLLVEENGKRILISGCSHKGILNLAEWFRPDVLIGGFHFKTETDPEVLRDAARQLLQQPTVYYTGHCTGDAAYGIMKEQMGDRLHSIGTGQVLTF